MSLGRHGHKLQFDRLVEAYNRQMVILVCYIILYQCFRINLLSPYWCFKWNNLSCPVLCCTSWDIWKCWSSAGCFEKQPGSSLSQWLFDLTGKSYHWLCTSPFSPHVTSVGSDCPLYTLHSVWASAPPTSWSWSLADALVMQCFYNLTMRMLYKEKLSCLFPLWHYWTKMILLWSFALVLALNYCILHLLINVSAPGTTSHLADLTWKSLEDHKSKHILHPLWLQRAILRRICKLMFYLLWQIRLPPSPIQISLVLAAQLCWLNQSQAFI